jgi:hypothetical protein
VIVITTHPDWTSVMTAIGTVAVAISAVGIAIWSDRRTGNRLVDQIQHSDQRLADERRAAREQEQLTEAWSVKVVGARMAPEPGMSTEPGQPIGRPVVVVFNHGRYTITRVDARFSPDGTSTVGHSQAENAFEFGEYHPGYASSGLQGPIGQAYVGAVTPGASIRFLGDTQLVSQLRSTFPIVRWVDRWGTHWEHRQGQVREVKEETPWTAMG